jgi:hypothetical protein
MAKPLWQIACLPPDTRAMVLGPAMSNAAAECLVLHIRILVEILVSVPAGTTDDICLCTLLPGFKSKLVNELKGGVWRRIWHRHAALAV